MGKPISQMIDTTVETVGAQGDGVASWNGQRLFLPFALAGERVRAEVLRRTGDGAQARVTEIVEASADRVQPDCRHFGDCGGCSLQHMDPAACAEWKRERVADALRRRGLGDVSVAPTVSIAPGTRRRAVFTYRVTVNGVVIGFNAPASRRIVDQTECPLLAPALADLVPALRDLLASLNISGASGDVWVTLLDSGLDVRLDLPVRPSLEMLERLTAFGRMHDLARLSWQQDGTSEPVAEFRPALLRIGGFEVSPPPGAFLQPSGEGEAAIAERVHAAVGDAFPVADLFCGIGTFALRLGGKGRIFGADGDPSLVAALAATGRVETEMRDLFRRPLAGSELAPFGAVVFDPPRAGAKVQAAALAEAGPPVVVAVSCNPATFARDARILVDGGYALAQVTPIDQFPWSPHVELTACFRR